MYYNDRDEYTEKHRKGPGWAYWHLWVLGISVAFAASQYMRNELLDNMQFSSNMDAVSWILFGAFRGLWMGFVQVAILWRFLDNRSKLKWWAVTVVAWGAGNAAVDIVQIALGNVMYQWFYYAPNQVDFVLTAIGGGLLGELVGLAQTPILQVKLQQAWRWRWSNLAAGVVAYVVALLVGNIVAPAYLRDMMRGCLDGVNSLWYQLNCFGRAEPSHEQRVVTAAIQGAIYAAITGFVLLDMLRHPRQAESTEHAPQVQH